jgi:hypothetical protein
MSKGVYLQIYKEGLLFLEGVQNSNIPPLHYRILLTSEMECIRKSGTHYFSKDQNDEPGLRNIHELYTIGLTIQQFKIILYHIGDTILDVEVIDGKIRIIADNEEEIFSMITNTHLTITRMPLLVIVTQRFLLDAKLTYK